MAKLQHTFVQGKMNKDLDERLIPNGQYRDASNVQVSTSEGADVGAVENIFGNTIKNKRDDATSFETWPSKFGLTTPFCIGTVRDTQNEKIYWFITSATADIIFEYDQITQVISPILVDGNGSILNFSANNIITGGNVFSGLLVWTDDLNEPRMIDIAVFKEGSAQAAQVPLWVNTSVYNRPASDPSFKASDITVIKQKPGTSPGYIAAPSARTGTTNGTGITPVTTIGTFTSPNSNNVQLPLAIGSSITFTTNLAANWIVDDIVIISATSINAQNYTVYFEVRGEIEAMSGTSATLKVLSISQGLNGTKYIWDCLLEEDEPMFNTDMPRFAYRWKYDNNLYSAFSPWTEAVFVPDVYDYDPQNAYNLAMTNNIRKLTINAFEEPPADVERIDILYKDSNSTLVYKVDDIPATATTFSITSELIYNVINSDQLIRAYDNVPRKAKSQELIGNRIVYGNYLQNYDIATTANLTVATTATDIATLLFPQASVKSLRAYQIGIVYLDVNGRETPVFTNDTATVIIPKTASDKVNTIKVTSSQTTPGTFATHFKYYLKNISNEYYNLILDRYYDSDDGNIWLSFPSAERNKIEIDDFIILKKENNTNVAVSEDAKYKIIDISNEAPASIRTQRVNKLRGNVEVGAAVNNQFVKINSGLSSFNFNGPIFADDRDFYDIWAQSDTTLYMQFTAIVTDAQNNPIRDTSQIYEIVSGGFNKINTSGGLATYNVVLTEAISANDTFLDGKVFDFEYSIIIYQDELTNSPVFEGKFFAKINRDAAFENAVLYNFTGRQGDYNVLATVPININIATPPGANQPAELDGWGWQENAAAPPSPFLFQPSFGSTTLGMGYAPFPSGGFTNSVNIALEANLVAGGVIQFRTASGGFGEIYEIASVTVTNNTPRYTESPAQELKIYRITLKTPYVDQATDAIDLVRVLGRKRDLNIVFNEFTKVLSSPNAAIFETEPAEAIDLELYYEASNSIPIGQLAATHTLPYFNCYSFGNGVESDRIRDDFNAKTIGKGVKVSSILEEGYKEERRGAGLIYGGLFNSTSGFNELNQFIAGLKITKDLNPIYGTIQKLFARDTDLVTFMEDKCFKILANKDALFNADGNSNVTSNNNVLGQTVPYVGAFGISKNPESFASFGFRSYFVDKARGAVMRLSRDGLTKISSNGMSDYFIDNLKLNTTGNIIGSYDSDAGSYNLAINVPIAANTESVAFKEKVNGWSSTMSYAPEAGISLNNEYYSFKDGEMWEHSNETRSNFYGAQFNSTVTPIINDAPTSVKNFKTLSYEGTAGWTAEIKTDQQDGAVTNWQKREGSFYNFIKGIASTWDYDTQKGTLDTQETSVQGIGTILTFVDAAGKFTITIEGAINDSLQIIPSDKIYYLNVTDNKIEEVGACTAIVGPVLTITPVGALNTDPSNGDFLFFAKDNVVNTSGIIGYFAETKMITTDSTKEELFAVNAEVFISSE